MYKVLEELRIVIWRDIDLFLISIPTLCVYFEV